jgi:polar amino acid transport system substrate-binding protein
VTTRPALPMRVGVDAAPPPPLCYGVPGGPAFEGFEVDLMQAVANRLERALTFRASLWTELLQQLQRGELDLICTAATITSERERLFLFSRPYLRTPLAVISRRQQPVRELLAVGGRVGVRAGTPAEVYVVDRNVQPLRFHFNEEMYHWLDQARLDAVIDDLPIGAWFAASLPALQISPLDATETQYGLVLRRDSAALKTALDEAIGAIIDDDTYARLYQRWLKPLLGDACDLTAGIVGVCDAAQRP